MYNLASANIHEQVKYRLMSEDDEKTKTPKIKESEINKTKKSDNQDEAKVSKQTTGLNNKIIVYLIVLILAVLQLVLYTRGLRTDFYRSLDITPLGLDLGSLIWFGSYILATIGYLWLAYKYPNSNIEFVLSLTVIGIILSIIWDINFFYIEDILGSVIVQLFACALYLWLVYVLFTISPIAGLLHIPILLYTYYQFYANVGLFLGNSEKSLLRPIYTMFAFDR